MIQRSIRFLGLSLLLATASGCGVSSENEPIDEVEAELLGSDTFLYLLCNATSWDTNDRSRLVESSPGSGYFSLEYEVGSDWMVSGSDSCSIVETNQKNGWGTVQKRYAFRSGQATQVVVPDARALSASSSSSFQIRYPFKGRYVANLNWHNGTLSWGGTVLPQRSLIERNEAALTQFDVVQTLTRIATNGGVVGGTAWHDAIFKNTARAASFPGESGPFCDSAGFPAQINGFTVGCAGNAAPLVGKVDKWDGLSVTNRFDLAPEGGENCGEARASFYMPPGNVTTPLRSFMIFEAVIPNPKPQLGLEGCRPVQEFWAGLSIIADPAARGAKLAQAFYTGEAGLTAGGFKPFFTFENFGPGKGRVRLVAQGGSPFPLWDFREFHLLAGGGAKAIPVAQSFPIAAFSNETHPKAAQCRAELLSTLGTLTPANFNFLGVDVPPSCFDGSSGNFGTRMEDVITVGGQPAWAAALEARAEAVAPSADLTAVQIAARTMFSGTCIGCHHRPDRPEYRDLGQGLFLPAVTPLPGESLDDVDFTHVNNLRTEPCATEGADASRSCFKLSQVLGGIFLPHRKSVLESYLRTPLGTFRPPAAGQTSTRTIGGTPNARTH